MEEAAAETRCVSASAAASLVSHTLLPRRASSWCAISLCQTACICVCVCVCMCARAHARVCMCLYVFVRASAVVLYERSGCFTPNIYQYSNLRFELKSEIWAVGDVTTDKSQIVIISR